jgi:hypothetical protein
LQTGFVTRTSSQSQGTQKLTQSNDIQFTPVLIARSTVILQDTATNEKVVTETIGTTNADFLRYVEISGSKAQVKDKSAIGSWAKKTAEGQAQPQILADALLGNALMFADFSNADKNKIISELKSTNAIAKYDLLTKETIEGWKIYTYNVVLNLAAYSKVYKNYLKLLGQDKLADEIGAQEEGATYQFKLSINASSRQPVILKVPGNENAEFYSNFGGRQPIIAPQTNQTINELQAKISGS